MKTQPQRRSEKSRNRQRGMAHKLSLRRLFVSLEEKSSSRGAATANSLGRNPRKVGLSRRRGFTLLEVLLVIAILGILMSLVVPRLVGRQRQANVDATKLNIKSVGQVLKMYAIDHGGDFPTTGDGLTVLVERPNGNDEQWQGPYVDEMPKDAWGNQFQYEYPGRHNSDGFDLASNGRDKTANTKDDLTNWKSEN